MSEHLLSRKALNIVAAAVGALGVSAGLEAAHLGIVSNNLANVEQQQQVPIGMLAAHSVDPLINGMDSEGVGEEALLMFLGAVGGIAGSVYLAAEGHARHREE